jgi:hypothetical protein
MLAPGTPPATKVRVADSILNHTAKAIELEDVEGAPRSWRGPAKKRNVASSPEMSQQFHRSNLGRRLKNWKSS